MLKVLFIGPFPDPITGNSLSNKVVYEGFKHREGYKVNRINTSLNFFDEKVGAFSFNKMFQSIRFNLQFYKIVFADVIYLTPGQTFFGVLKYSLFILLSRILQKKIVIHIHGNHLHKSYHEASSFKKKIMKIILSKADKGVVLSESLIHNLSPFLPKENIHVVYNFVENYLVEHTQNAIKLKTSSSLKIIYLSNLMEEKGILDLLEALKLMEEKGVVFEAKIAGNIDNDSKIKINNYLNELNQVDYLGVVSGEKKKALLIWGNVFVFPSFYKMEGQPISLLEAMCTGNLILTTDHAGISDVFKTNVHGLFIAKKSPKDIMSKLIELQSNYENYQGIHIANFNHAKENFSTDAFLNNLEAIIK